MRIILASASPRRRELLEQIKIPFEVQVSHVEEKVTSTKPERVVEELSSQKACAVLELVTESGKSLCAGPEPAAENGEAVLVIGADTVVALEGQILGKPADEAAAVEMLRRLSGREHQVYTGVTLLYRAADGTEQRKCFHERTSVFFCPMSEWEIRDYADTGDPMDKAGAYGIQGLCARYISGIEGDYNNVVGLPVGRLYQEIKEWLE